ncbi:hypothetical protein P152DRAFT_461350 [Eremomyces bilateralis CBS 781.70]|uniref:U three protein 23 n=1 Tax=Eremomyces bilateralis CBS 781.70 TaxID=1392243 RepID=A0A6G1FVI2_9PEZI|nr:uncharacterized protein P152DRAFT_461350 [Eremomyces bilateralis CBS 781.70]KAF1809671.1 hypothetical protein P152DRAFT_461350 [Eremomyces bilateralis CBS 781.70]
MRLKRAKAYRKLLHSYKLHFGFREPFQVIVDAEFVQDAAKCKMDILPAITRTLQGEVKPMITQCSMRHLYATKDSQLIDQAKTFERRRCGHHELDEPLSTLECLSSVVDAKDNKTNKHRYIIASQEREVRIQMRQIPGIPILFIDRSVLILEDMSAATVKECHGQERSKFLEGLKTRGTLGSPAKRKRAIDDEANAAEKDVDDSQPDEVKAVKKKHRGPKAPNPLSVKKRTKPTHTSDKPRQAEGEPSGNKSQGQESNGAPDHAESQEAGQKKKRKRTRKVDKGPADGGDAGPADGETLSVGSPG